MFNTLSNLASALRLAWDFYGYARHPYTLDQSIHIIREGLAHREANFLAWVERHVYGRPRSPYLALLKAAGCELGDLRHLVGEYGLEGALERLREAGVYVTYEEFKGKQEVVRGSQRFQFREKDFDNPAARAHITARTGGSSGMSVTAPVDIRRMAHEAATETVTYAAHGLEHIPWAIWRLPPPDPVAIIYLLLVHSMTRLPTAARWFTPVPLANSPGLASGDWILRGLRILGRAVGRGYPAPEYVPRHEAHIIARWLADVVSKEGRVLLAAGVSNGLEVVKAAREEHLDLAGAVFWLGSEPVTPGRAAQFTSSGVRVIQNYAATETGRLAFSCPKGEDFDDLHLLTDKIALITHERPLNGAPFKLWLFTTLHPYAGKLLLNVEIDDTGVLFQRPCGCLMEQVGYTTHISQIRSVSKLTAHGSNILGIDLVRILDEVLPARFGGSPIDYQLLEEEAEDGTPRLTLLIDPEVGALDEQEVLATVLGELRRGRPSYVVTAEVWEQAQALRIERRRPIATGRGKVLPLYFAEKG